MKDVRCAMSQWRSADKHPNTKPVRAFGWTVNETNYRMEASATRLMRRLK